MAAHKAQHLIASALQRNMEMRHKGTTAGTEFYQLIRNKVGLQTGYPVTLYALYTVKSPHEVKETLPRGTTEITYINTCQHYLPAPFTDHLARLLSQRGY